MRGRRREQSLSDLVPRALHALGVPSARLSSELESAFARALDPAWRGQVRLERLQGGVLDVAVSSAPLKDELTRFHAPRLLAVLRASLPDITLLRIRFLARAPETAR